MTRASGCLDILQQGMLTRPDHVGNIKALINTEEIILARCLTINELAKPITGFGGVIEDDVGHYLF